MLNFLNERFCIKIRHVSIKSKGKDKVVSNWKVHSQSRAYGPWRYFADRKEESEWLLVQKEDSLERLMKFSCFIDVPEFVHIKYIYLMELKGRCWNHFSSMEGWINEQIFTTSLWFYLLLLMRYHNFRSIVYNLLITYFWE